MNDFELHPRLAADTVNVGHLRLCRLLMMDDANYPWFILVPQRPGLVELHELDDDDLACFVRESAELSRALLRAFDGGKMNVAALGNVVPQLHVHHVVRFATDAAWPAPIWGRVPVAPMGEAEQARRVDALRAAAPPDLVLDARWA